MDNSEETTMIVGLPSPSEECTGSAKDWQGDWFHLNLNKNDLCFLQDTVHILTKLRTRILKRGVILPMGKFTANVKHLQKLIQHQTKDKHFITKSDLIPEDKMNYESARRMCDEKAMHLLNEIPDSAGTNIYLKMMNFLIKSFIDKDVTLSERLYAIWYTIFFLRLWRTRLRNHSKFKLSDNFISSNCYTCIEMNGHMLIKLIYIFQEDDTFIPEMFCPWLFSSQTCEHLFRSARSLTSTHCTMINFSIKDFISRVDRIALINEIKSDLCNNFIFPREQKRMKMNTSTTITKNCIESIDIKEIIKMAQNDAINDAFNLKMDVNINMCNILDLSANLEEVAE
ncbi:hypothetical protein FQR65_LT18364 [Abscondita terminalis]|nr:hypothetical protein FQR65_LT18364 [Abscondita terminalis]